MNTMQKISPELPRN